MARPVTKTLREMQVMGERKDRMPNDPVDRIGQPISKIDGLGEIGQKIFNYLEEMLRNNGTLDTCDFLTFFILCDTWERWYLKRQEVKEKGDYITYTTHKDEVITQTAPWFRQERELCAAVLKSCHDFGITPTARRNVEKVVRGEKVNIFDGLT